MANLSTTQVNDLVMYYDDLVDYISLKLGNRQVAREVVQETYLRILQKPEHFSNLQSPIAFLKKVSLNIALDYVKKNQTYDKYFDHGELDPSDEVAMFGDLSEQELSVTRQQYSQLILTQISKLPPACQDVFLLVQFHGMSQVDVADQLQISRTMVIKHLTRALQSFLPIFIEEQES